MSALALASHINPIALRKAKIVCNFGLSECNRVKVLQHSFLCDGQGAVSHGSCTAHNQVLLRNCSSPDKIG